jgi:hypothetical protein
VRKLFVVIKREFPPPIETLPMLAYHLWAWMAPIRHLLLLPPWSFTL